jgi:hypothetical protein
VLKRFESAQSRIGWVTNELSALGWLFCFLFFGLGKEKLGQTPRTKTTFLLPRLQPPFLEDPPTSEEISEILLALRQMELPLNLKKTSLGF